MPPELRQQAYTDHIRSTVGVGILGASSAPPQKYIAKYRMATDHLTFPSEQHQRTCNSITRLSETQKVQQSSVLKPFTDWAANFELRIWITAVVIGFVKFRRVKGSHCNSSTVRQHIISGLKQYQSSPCRTRSAFMKLTIPVRAGILLY
jgi:hypothetical protein